MPAVPNADHALLPVDHFRGVVLPQTRPDLVEVAVKDKTPENLKAALTSA